MKNMEQYMNQLIYATAKKIKNIFESFAYDEINSEEFSSQLNSYAMMYGEKLNSVLEQFDTINYSEKIEYKYRVQGKEVFCFIDEYDAEDDYFENVVESYYIGVEYVDNNYISMPKTIWIYNAIKEMIA